MAPAGDEDIADQGRTNGHPQKPLKPDAIAADGVLSMLTSPAGGSEASEGSGSNSSSRSDVSRHGRAMSAGSRAQLEAQDRQMQYNANRLSLERWLGELDEILGDLLDFNKGGTVVVPAKLPLSVLQLELKLGASSVDVGGNAAMRVLESKLLQVMQHTAKLQSRISNTDSRVLVTGDLNAGKSSLCNALLRRNVLPVDQQPCTDVFCEVVDCAKNQGIEEIHAVPKDSTYDVLDSKTYHPFSLAEIEGLVHKSNEYKLLVVYLRDPRPPERSLLSNGIVDILLIDAPGLNVSDVTTTELFGRQEEIDLVIFVVSAENHFTQSAKEFVADTAREKSLVFIAVNNYDRIRDKDRCRDRVLRQVATLAPETYKGSEEFIHFVSSKPDDDPAGDGPDGGEGGRGNNHQDLDRLEAAVRNFVLDRRSASKLAPARTFLKNVLQDLCSIAKENTQLAKHEQAELSRQLGELAPVIDNSIGEYAKVSDKIERDSERLVSRIQTDTVTNLSTVVATTGDEPMVEYHGFFSMFEYASETRDVLVQRIQQAVIECEDSARKATASAVDGIKQLGILHVGDQPAFRKVFQPSAMFSRRKDNLGKQITAEFSVVDIFDVTALLERPLPVSLSSKQALVSAAAAHATYSGAIGGAVTALSLYQGAQASVLRRIPEIVGMRRLAVPLVVLAAIGLGAWIVHELPRTIPRRLARKIAYEIDGLGYVQSNAERIAGECRKVLRYPALDVRSAFQSQLETRTRQREVFEEQLQQAEYALSVFNEIEGRAGQLDSKVRGMHLTA